MKILITGVSGLLGKALRARLPELGHTVYGVGRTRSKNVELTWQDNFPEVDAAIHLAGGNVAAGRWTKKFIQEMHESRVGTAKLLRQKLTESCKTVITASGANCYAFGNGSDAPKEESAGFGEHESGKICQAWEGAWAGYPGRFVALRLGFVIAPGAHGVEIMLPWYKACLGGVIGSGRQRMSWIGLEDLVRVFERAIFDERMSGPVNAVAPKPVSYREFNEAFAQAVRRPAIFPIPGFVMRLLYGKMADELILADYAVEPKKLKEAGFEWYQSDIGQALKKAVG